MVANERAISFETTVSAACFNPLGNGFSLPLKVFDSDGMPLGAEFFPIDVGFNVNGLDFTQQLTFLQQELLIGKNLPGIDLDQLSSVTVQIESASDKSAEQYYPVNGEDVHVRTIYPVPEIDFTYSDNEVDKSSTGTYKVDISTGETQNAVYQWSVDPPEGTGTDLKLLTGNEANIFWDGPPGYYNLSVFVIDGNGCYSDTIGKRIELRKSDPVDFMVNAGPDTIIGSCDPYTFAAVYPADNSLHVFMEPGCES